jgi:hypothetical protein
MVSGHDGIYKSHQKVPLFYWLLVYFDGKWRKAYQAKSKILTDLAGQAKPRKARYINALLM